MPWLSQCDWVIVVAAWAWGRNAVLVRLVQAGSVLPATVNPSLAASSSYLSQVLAFSIALQLQVELFLFMRSGASEKGHKHFFFAVYLMRYRKVAKWIRIFYFLGVFTI